MPGGIEPHEPDDETWALGEERLRVLMELAACGRLTAAAMEAAARDLGIGRSRCHELLRRCRRSPTVTALLPCARGRAHGARVLAPEVEAVVTARFYGRPAQALMAEAGTARRPADLSGVDLGVSRAALAPVAELLGADVERLASHTIAAAHPWATGLVAKTLADRNGRGGPRLRYAARPHCLEQQRAERGASWLRRAWVPAPRTVCPVHHVAMTEGQPGAAARPAWSGSLRLHRRCDVPVCAVAQDSSGPVRPARRLPDDGPAGLLHRGMAAVQDGILALAARGQGSLRSEVAAEGRAVVAADLVWAFTRADRHFPDRLIHEAFSSDLLDDAWRLARRRRPGPVGFAALHVDQRHLLLSTASVRAGPPALRRAFRSAPGGRRDDLATLHHRLRGADRTDLAEPRKRWPDRA